VGSAVETVMGSNDDLLGGKFLLFGGVGSADAKQPGDVGHLESGAGMEEEMAEQAGRVGVAALLLAKPQDGGEQGSQVCCAVAGRNVRLFEPSSEVAHRHGHETSSRASSLQRVYPVSTES